MYRLALEDSDEIPVIACLFVDDNSKPIFSKNTVERDNNPFKHAEINVLEKGFEIKNSRYLKDATLIVTLEPCLMCMGAILKAGVKNLYYLSDDKENGSLSYYHVFCDNKISVHQIDDERFDNLLKKFFKNLRG